MGPIMPDDKEMYLHLMRETEKAIRLLIEAQQTCEQMVLDAEEPRLFLLPHGPADPD